MEISSDEIKSYIAHKLETAFDKLITNVASLKVDWIDKHFKLIMEGINLDNEITYPNLAYLQTEIEQTFFKIHKYINSDEQRDFSELMKLRLPEEFSHKIRELTNNLNMRKEFKKVEVEVNFEGECIKKMLKIKGIDISKVIYTGNIASTKDLKFILSQLPRPVKEMKLLFTAARDGFTSAKFHTKCDEYENTLVIAKANGHVFGGFAKPAWHSRNEWSDDNSGLSFLFTCRNGVKHKLRGTHSAIKGDNGRGPSFGGGPAWIIRHGNEGYVSLGSTYSIPEGAKQEDYMAGTGKGVTFKHDDYEVHQIIFE